MSDQPLLLIGRRRALPLQRWLGGVLLCCLVAGVVGCAGKSDKAGVLAAGREARAPDRAEPDNIATGFPAGAEPVGLEFLYVFENERSAPYFPIEGIGGLAFAPDGTLIFCDEKGGRIHALDPDGDQWYLFDSSPGRPFRPVDIHVDGFSVLVLDFGDRLLLRYDMRGVYQDRLLSFQHLDPVIQRLPTAFDIDRDGRVVVTDAAEQQVLLLDPFLALTQTLGEPGSHREQFDEPSGVVFLPDGSFLVADRGNRRLQKYSRLGYFEQVIGGEFDLDNPFLTPQGLDCDDHGNIFVADPAGSTVHVLDANLALLFSVGWKDGLLAAPEIPIDVAVGPDDLLAIADRGKQAVLVYRIVYE
jgi:sugar lactone lactonase YvrE